MIIVKVWTGLCHPIPIRQMGNVVRLARILKVCRRVDSRMVAKIPTVHDQRGSDQLILAVVPSSLSYDYSGQFLRVRLIAKIVHDSDQDSTVCSSHNRVEAFG